MNEIFRQQILAKANELNQCSFENLTTVREIVNELRAHISGNRQVEKSRIEYQVSKLTFFTLGIPVSIPLNSDTLFTRGVKYEENDGGDFYRDVSRLSYIPPAIAYKTRQNRLNNAGESIFYASFDTLDRSVATVLAEIGVVGGDIVNLLYSKTRGDQPGALHVLPIGIMDFFRRGESLPFNLHPVFKEIYDLLRASTNPPAMEAVHICDEFMNEALTAKVVSEEGEKTNRLYDVTCAFAKDFLATPQVDGILYQSTKSSNFPNVALKPASVDQKLIPVGAVAYIIVEKDDEAEFKLRCLANGIVEDDRILWVNHTGFL